MNTVKETGGSFEETGLVSWEELDSLESVGIPAGWKFILVEI